MLMFLVSQSLSAWFAFLLPCYTTFKVLSHEPISQPELQKLAIHWTVIGAFVAFEYIAEWFVSWLPFYWELKTLFLLFLSLPQIQGSAYIYNAYLLPFLKKNEADIDASIIAAQQGTLAFIQTRLTNLWDFVWSIINKSPASSQSNAPGVPQQAQPGPALSLQSAMGLWKAYGPSVLGAFQPAARPASGASVAGARASPAVSSSVQVPRAERRSPPTPESEPLPSPYGISPSITPAPSTPSSTAPSFPEPQFH